MLKKVLIGVALALGVVSAKADTGIYNVCNDSITFVTVSVASSTVLGTATGVNQLLSATLTGATTNFLNLLENRKYMAFSNPSATVSILLQVGLSSTSANGDLSLVTPGNLSTTSGLVLSPASTLVLDLTSRDNSGRVFVPYGVNSGGSVAVPITITQCRSK